MTESNVQLAVEHAAGLWERDPVRQPIWVHPAVTVDHVPGAPLPPIPRGEGANVLFMPEGFEPYRRHTASDGTVVLEYRAPDAS